ncbi:MULTISPECIES: hypothetical protein [unclassified Streptomyces]|uniref:hypothetical protein n=1 Tax=unclassified Streptomyces TaxID=2593676 RepID=UPI00093D400E|nr:hypothetical protein [Streptomyces sp. TSRI0107]OKJ87684.1 hypothetical protein AMK31_11020 [Streptomyces sp. TSRI0107]
MYREFIVPSDHDILEAIGEWPESEQGSDARTITLRDEDDERILLSYDALARSVRVRREDRNGEVTLDIFREGATHMTIHSSAGATHILIEFQMGECAGKMEIQTTPALTIADRLLFT